MGRIRLSKSSLSQAEQKAVSLVLEKEYLGMGSEVRLFEEELKAYIETEKKVMCVNTGTSALHISLLCLDIGPGDEVLVPSLTYLASFQAISAVGAVPVACDVEEDTLFIDLKDAQKRLTSKTRAILPVHYASNSGNMPAVYRFAENNSLRVIEDAAHSFGCVRNGFKIGCEGDIICFSFDGIKNITCGEGGAVISSDKKFAQRVQDARLLSVEKDTEKRYAGQRSWDFDVEYQGFRYHMSNIMAAIGRVQLQRFADFSSTRVRIADRYLKNLQIKELSFLKFDYSGLVPHIFVVKAENRDGLRQYLLENDIESGIHYKPNHLLTKFQAGYSLPVTEKIYEKIITLPCHADLSEAEQDLVIEKIRSFYAR